MGPFDSLRSLRAGPLNGGIRINWLLLCNPSSNTTLANQLDLPLKLSSSYESTLLSASLGRGLHPNRHRSRSTNIFSFANGSSFESTSRSGAGPSFAEGHPYVPRSNYRPPVRGGTPGSSCSSCPSNGRLLFSHPWSVVQITCHPSFRVARMACHE